MSLNFKCAVTNTAVKKRLLEIGRVDLKRSGSTRGPAKMVDPLCLIHPTFHMASFVFALVKISRIAFKPF